jgi:PadR family transcriptional regulator PadR
MDFSKEMLKGVLDSLVLYVIAQEPKHGYRVAKAVSELAKGQLEIQDGTLYPILHRLEQKRLIKGAWIKEVSARQRREYQITPAGIAALKDQAGQWRILSGMLNQIMEDVL